MTKEQAWDILSQIVNDGVNCWERNDGKSELVSLAYLCGVVEALNMAIIGK